MSIPHLFRCPISLDLFTDPVTLSTGQTYDRSSIERWLAGGNTTCPVTMQRLHDTSLVPNLTLQHLIDQWLLSVPQQQTHSSFKNDGADSGTVSSLASLKLSLQFPGSATMKLEILKKVRILSAESDTGHACLIQLGYFPLLLQILFQTPIDSELVELSLDCVLSLLPSAQLDSLNILNKEPNLASFLILLEEGNVRIKTGLCQLLETISTTNATQDLCLVLGQSRRVLQVVVSLLNNRTDSRASEAAVGAISGICSLEANRGNAVREGAVDALVFYLMMNSSERRKSSSLALATLAALAATEAGKKSLVKNSNAVRVLVKSVFKVSSSAMRENEGSEYAVEVLLVVCCESAKATAEAVNAGVLTQVLLLLQSQCGCRAKAKARALLKLLRSVWARDPAAGLGANFYHVV